MRRNTQTVLSVFDIDPFRIGGTEAYARELSSQLAERGWKSVLCFNNEPAEQVRRYLALPNVQIEVLRNPSSFGWSTLRRLARILRRHRPRTLHIHFMPFLGPYPWVARLLGVERIFITDHASRPADYAPRPAVLWKRLAARLINWPVTGTICISDYVYECSKIRDLLPVKRLRRIHNGVDFSRAGVNVLAGSAFRNKHSIPDGRTLVVQVSWMIPEKGVSDLLKAAKIVLSQSADVHFVFVGEGSHKNQFAEQASALGLDGYVTWAGLVVDPLGEGVYSAADVVCQVSRWQEGFGWTIAEAMSCSKPVIATRVGGIPELVQDGLNGFLVPPGDAAAIATKIILLLEDSEMRKRMGQAAQRIAKEKFDLKKNVAELLQFYGLQDEFSAGP